MKKTLLWTSILGILAITACQKTPTAKDSLTLTPADGITVNHTEQTAKVTVTSSSSWSLTQSQDYDWVTPSKLAGETGDEVIFTIKANSGKKRVANFIFTCGSCSVEYYLSQNKYEEDPGPGPGPGPEPEDEIKLAESSHTFTSAAGVFEVKVTASDNWTATADAEWVTVTKSGAPNTMAAISVIENTTTTTRTAVITFTCGKATAKFAVSQNGKSSGTSFATPNMKTIDFACDWKELDATPDNVSFECWINTAKKEDPMDKYGNQSIIGAEACLLMRIEDDQFQVVYDASADGNSSVEGKIATDVIYNQWVHLCMTWTRGDKVCLYVNGTLKASEDAPAHGVKLNGLGRSYFDKWCSMPKAFYIGNAYDAKRYIQGTMAYARVWKKALTATEIAANMSKENVSDNNLLAYWKMTEGEGNQILDSTNNGYNLKALGFIAKGNEPETDIEWVEIERPF